MDLRAEAEELAMALEFGIASVDEVVDWADAHIVALDKPPYELIAVSTSGREPAAEIAHLLRALPGDVDIPSVSGRVIARMAAALDRGVTTPESIAKALYSMQLDGSVPDPEAASDMARLDDAFDLAHQGTYGTLEEARRDLREFLDRYAR